METPNEPAPPPPVESLPVVTEVRTHLQRWHAETAAAAATLHALRADVDANMRQIENPKAAYELIDFFADFFLGSSEDFDRLALELERGIAPEHASGLRHLAAFAAGEQGRCLRFLDQCLNRVLPYEQQRPLLARVLSTARDQLSRYHDLNGLAATLDTLAPPPDSAAIAQGAQRAAQTSDASGDRTLDRRQLFTRFFRR